MKSQSEESLNDLRVEKKILQLKILKSTIKVQHKLQDKTNKHRPQGAFYLKSYDTFETNQLVPSDFNNIIYALPKFSRRDYISLMQTLKTIMGFDTSDEAKFRFHVLEVFYTSGWNAVKLAFPNLKRVALGLHRNSQAMTERFKQEALKRENELESFSLDDHLIKLTELAKKTLSKTSNRTAEDALMLSTLFQNYAQKKLI